MTVWQGYDTARPDAAGFYEWKLHHSSGVEMQFHAKMRTRGAGHRSVLSPEFDRWDGYRIITPPGLEWREVGDPEEAERSAKNGLVRFPEIEFAPCPFCGNALEVEASQCGYPGGGDGVVICPSPDRYNTFMPRKCCRFIAFVGFPTPQALAEAWNSRPSK